jgi:hypothetical protein
MLELLLLLLLLLLLRRCRYCRRNGSCRPRRPQRIQSKWHQIEESVERLDMRCLRVEHARFVAPMAPQAVGAHACALKPRAHATR